MLDIHQEGDRQYSKCYRNYPLIRCTKELHKYLTIVTSLCVVKIKYRENIISKYDGDREVREGFLEKMTFTMELKSKK